MAAVNVPQLVSPSGGQPARPQLVLLQGGRADARTVDAHVYARRRLVAVALAILAIVAVLIAAQRLSTAGVPDTTDGGVVSTEAIGSAVHVVQPGETLWDIARAIAPEADPRVVVAMLIERNGDAPLQAGQRLELP